MVKYNYSPSDLWPLRRYFTITHRSTDRCVLFLPSHSLAATVASLAAQVLLLLGNAALPSLACLFKSARGLDYHTLPQWIDRPFMDLWSIRCTELHDPSMELSFIIFARIQFEFPSILLAPHALLVISCPSGTVMCENYCKCYVRRPMSIFNEQERQSHGQ